jgi:hypothetical protein
MYPYPPRSLEFAYTMQLREHNVLHTTQMQYDGQFIWTERVWQAKKQPIVRQIEVKYDN